MITEEGTGKDLNTEKDKPIKKSLIKKIFKIFGYIVLTLIGLNFLLYLLLSIPSVQQKVVNYAVNELKSMLKTEVSIDEIRLSLFSNVDIKGLYVEDLSKDTLLYAKHLEVDLSPWDLIKKGELAITGIELDDFVINITQKDSVSNYNFQFIIDTFSSGDTSKVDTTSSALRIVIHDVNIERGKLNYDVLSVPRTQGIFNASHISLYDFATNVDLNSIDPDNLNINLNKLEAKESSGLQISNLSGLIRSEKSQLWIENLALILPNSHLKAEKIKYNLSNEEFDIEVNDTQIVGADFTSFLPNLGLLSDKISIKTSAKGKLPAIDLEKIELAYGDHLLLDGRVSMSSYEDYGNADISLVINQFKVTPQGVRDMARLGDSTFVAPDILTDMEDIFLKGDINGKLSKLNIEAEAWCKFGAITLIGDAGTDTTFTKMSLDASLETQNFDLGKLMGDGSQLGKVSAHLDVRAKQAKEGELFAELHGVVDELHYNKEVLKAARIEGFYNPKDMGAKIDLTGPHGGILHADANMTQAKNPNVKLNLNIDNFGISRIYDNKDWDNPILSFQLKADLTGLDIDQMTGQAKIENFRLKDSIFDWQPGDISLALSKQDEANKDITLTSKLVSANIHGNYNFATIYNEFSSLMHKCLPSVFAHTVSPKQNKNNFKFNVTIENTEAYSKIFALPVDVITPIKINGLVNTPDQSIVLKADIPLLRYDDIAIKDAIIGVGNQDSTFAVRGKSEIHTKTDQIDLSINMDGVEDSMHSLIKVNSDGFDLHGSIEALARFEKDEQNKLKSILDVVPSDITLGKLKVNLLPAHVVNVGEITSIENLGINLNGKKYFGVEGRISTTSSDSLHVYFDKAQVGDILKAFNIDYVQAVLHGELLITNVINKPELYVDNFNVGDIIVYNDTIGSLSMISRWNEASKGVAFKSTLQRGFQRVALIDGLYSVATDSLNVRMRFNKFDIGWAKPFAEGTLSELKGGLSSDISIKGSINNPKISGFLGFNEASIGIDYTNVIYTISDTININPNEIGFKNLKLNDNLGNTATVNAKMTHKDYKDLKFDLNMKLDKLMVLNTEHRSDSLFYGKVFASGNVNIKGDDKKLDISMQIKNDKNSKLNILIPQTSEATEYKSVVYINVPKNPLDSVESKTAIVKPDLLPINLSVALDLNEDMQLGIVIDPVTGDAMQVKGKGNVNFAYDMRKDLMTTYGKFMLTSGHVNLNLQNIKKLDFQIREGSSLTFIGDPLKTSFDIVAYRRLRADLKTLDMSFESESKSTKVQVDCELGINGNMNKMDLSYDISLPGSDDDFQRKVSSIINTDEQKITQFAYLIAAGTFHSNSGGGTNFADGMWTNLASSALSSGLNSALGNILGDKWEVGANIESNDGSLSNMDMSVSVSTKFFDDRLKLNTNLGYRTDNSTMSDNSLVGDFEAEYALNHLWTLRGYNKTNNRYEKQAPTTQGIGVDYTKEASSLRLLFQSFKPRRRNRTRQNGSDSIQRRRDDSLQIRTDSLRIPIDSLPVRIDSIKPLAKDSLVTFFIQKQPAIITNRED